jgi:DNA helicase-2/ATP-dependent DNA helicase PcrA
MLNHQQEHFVQLESPFIRLLAPAGSGKTLALLHRCLELNRKSTSNEFLLFSYTRAAVMELRNRINTDETFTSIRDNTDITTINAWGATYLKDKEKISDIHNQELVSEANERKFTVLNSLQPIWKQQQYEKIGNLLIGKNKVRCSKKILELIDTIKTLGVNVDEFIKKDENYVDVWEQYLALFEKIGLKDYVERGDFAKTIESLKLHERKQAKTESEAFAKNFLPFFVDAVEQLKSTGLYTFEDQKYFPFLDLLRKNKDGEKSKRRKKLHIFIDEFQDSNPLDLKLFQELTKYENANLVIVGDDDQAIYQFRGTTPKFILSPKQFWGNEFETVIFETNYRSPKNIIEHSQRLIKHNSMRVDKQIKSFIQESIPIKFLNGSQNITIFEAVANQVDTCTQQGKNVVLVGRRRGDLLPYEIIFGGKKQPFYVDTDLNVFNSDTYKNLTKLLKIKSYPKWYPSDIADVTDCVFRYKLSAPLRNDLVRKLGKIDSTDSDAMLNELYDFIALQNKDRLSKDSANIIVEWFKKKNVAETLRLMANKFHGFQKDFYRSDEDVFYTEPPFDHLIEFATEYDNDFGKFYGDLTNAATSGKRYGDSDLDTTININVMTAFRTKGREFDTVIILDSDSDSWPNRQAKSEEEKETERRLFYVAVTRAKKELIFAGTEKNPTPYLSEMGLE